MHRSTGSHQISGGKPRVASREAFIKSIVVLYGSVFLYQKIDLLITENTKLFFDIKKTFSDIKKSLSDIKKRREKNQILDIRKSTLFSDIKNSIS